MWLRLRLQRLSHARPPLMILPVNYGGAAWSPRPGALVHLRPQAVGFNVSCERLA